MTQLKWYERPLPFRIELEEPHYFKVVDAKGETLFDFEEDDALASGDIDSSCYAIYAMVDAMNEKGWK